MKPFVKRLVLLCVMGFVVCNFVGCQKEEGTAEKVGKKIDQAIDSAKKKIHEATE